MTNYQRLTAKVFGETATATGNEPEIGQFGSALAGTYVGTTDVATIQNLTAWSNGFIDCVTPSNQFPPLPEMTGFGKVLSYHEAYLLQKGIAEWDSATTYYHDDFCRVGHTVYYSLQDENINHNPTTDTMYWKDFTIGANQELSNLTDAGEERLHALKGYLENGQSYSDTTLYNDVYYYNHSTFDVSKFTVAGTPTITNDGIASVTANGNMTQRVSIPFNFDLTAKKWSIISNFTTDTTVSAKYVIGSWQTNDSFNCYYVGSYVFNFTLYVNIEGTRTQIASGNTSLFNLVQFRTNTKYVQIISRDNNTYTYTIYNASNPSENGTITITSEYDLYNANVLCVYSNSSTSSLKSCNLKEVKVVVNDYPTFSGNKTGIVTIKPDDYTVVGTPTINADGIASNFSSSNYIKLIQLSELKGHSWRIEVPMIYLGNSSSENNSIIQFGYDWANVGCIAYQTGAKRFNFRGNFGSSGDSTGGGTKIYQPTQATIKNSVCAIEFDINAGTYTMFVDGVKVNDSSNPYTPSTTIKEMYNIYENPTDYLYISYSRNAEFPNAVDLNGIKIYVDGDLIYQPCLLIPYTESSTGSKIVDVAYRDRVIDVYQQFGSANYYTIDEVNQNATLPMGEVYGFIEQKTDTNLSNVTQTAINTSISWGMPDWSRAISKTVYTEYTATERGWINAEGKSADKKVGLTINSNIVAAAEATGTSDESCFACLVPIDIGDVYNTFKTGTNVQDKVTSIQFIPCKGEA